MRKYIALLFVMIFLVGTVNATLEGAAFGFAKDMSISYLSSQNPALGQAISFVMCPQCAMNSQAMSALNKALPGSSDILNALQSPEAYVVGKAKQQALTEIYKQLEPEEQASLSNILKMQPYIEKAFDVNPNAPKEKQKGSIEITENGDTIIKDGEGNIFATIPQGFEAVESKDKFILINKNAKEDAILEIKGYKIQADKDSQISFSEIEGMQTINLESGDIQAGDTKILGVKNSTIQLDEENQVQFAEFTSEKGGIYTFNYNEKDYEFKAKEGGKVIFNPKENSIKGENTELNFDEQTINSTSFSAVLDENGNFKEIRLLGGNFEDNKRGLEYSSEQDFSIYFDARDISKEQNAISIFDEERKVNAKGFVKILKPDKLSYIGESQEAFVNYHIDSNFFEMRAGNAVIKNKKNIIYVKDGENIVLERENLDSSIEAESFTVKTNKNGKEYAIDEKKGELTVAVTDENGKTKTTLMQRSLYEEAVSERVKGDKEIREMKSYLEDLKFQGASQEEIDSTELSILSAENIQSASVGNVDEAITRLETYLKESRIPEAESHAKFALAEMYAAKATANEFDSGHLILGEKSPFALPLYYKTEVINGKEVVTGWSPDGVEYIPLSKTVIPKDYPIDIFQGKSPTKENIKLINELRINNNIDFLKGAAISRNTGLTGDLIGDTEEYKSMRESYKQSIDLFRELKDSASKNRNEELFVDANMQLGAVYHELGAPDIAIGHYQDIIKKVRDEGIRSRAYSNLALMEIEESLYVNALQSLEESIKLNPDNQDAITLKQQLQSGILETINTGLGKESEEMQEAIFAKFGGEGPSSFLGAFSEIFTKSYDIVEASIVGDSYNLQFEDKEYKIGQQQMGIMVIGSLAEKGYDLNEFYLSNPETQKRIIAQSRGVDIDYDVVETFSKAAIAAQKNPDVALMMTNGALRQVRRPGYLDIYDYVEEDFKFKTGENYIDPGSLTYTWKDKVTEQINLKNAALFLVPVSTVTVAGKTLTVAGQIGRAAQAIPGVSKVAGGVKSVKGSIGSWRALQWAADKSPTTVKLASWVVGEGLESTVGFAVDKVAPGLGMPTEILLGHGQVFDMAQEVMESTGKKGAVKVGKALLTEDGELIQSLIVKDRDAYSSFLKAGGDKIKYLEGELIEIQGRKILLMSENPAEKLLHGSLSPSLLHVADEGLLPSSKLIEKRKTIFSGSASPFVSYDKVYTTNINGLNMIKPYVKAEPWTPQWSKEEVKKLRELISKTEASKLKKTFEKLIELEELQQKNFISLSKIEKQLIEDPYEVVYMITKKGEDFKPAKLETHLISSATPDEIVAYVQDNKLEFTKQLIKEQGSKMQVRALSSLESDIEFYKNMGIDPSFISKEKVIGSASLEEIAQANSRNINNFAEAILEAPEVAEKRVVAFHR